MKATTLTRSSKARTTTRLKTEQSADPSLADTTARRAVDRSGGARVDALLTRRVRVVLLDSGSGRTTFCPAAFLLGMSRCRCADRRVPYCRDPWGPG